MTLHYTLIFGLLVTEMSLISFLLLPLPLRLRKACFMLTQSSLVSSMRIIAGAFFCFVGLLFIDSLVANLKTSRDHGDSDHQQPRSSKTDTYLHAKMFYSRTLLFFELHVLTQMSCLENTIVPPLSLAVALLQYSHRYFQIREKYVPDRLCPLPFVCPLPYHRHYGLGQLQRRPHHDSQSEGTLLSPSSDFRGLTDINKQFTRSRQASRKSCDHLKWRSLSRKQSPS